MELVQRERTDGVLLDLRDLTYLDSAGIRALLYCREEAERAGRRLEISQAHPHARRILDICELTELFGLPAA